MVYSETFPSRIEAMKREWQLKKWSRAKKEALIKGDLELLKKNPSATLRTFGTQKF